jgi:two-component system response regulator YesN
MILKKIGFNRHFLSYVPVIFITTTMIIFLFISMISEISIKETEKANEVFSKYVLNSMDTTLHSIERLILEEMENNENFNSFFEPNPSSDHNMINYEASTEIGKIIRENPLIFSIYLYRQKDETIISRSFISKKNDFEDKDFLLQVYNKPQRFGWYPVRDYREYSQDVKEQVLTMTKKAMLPFGKQGIVVVNIRVESLLEIVDEMMNKDITFMNIWSGDNTKVYPNNNMATEETKQGQDTQGKVVTQIHSDYIGWDFVSGLKAGRLFAWVSFISRIWLGLGIVTFIFSVFYIFYVTKRNYKPVENIISQIQSYQNRNDHKGHGDEFSFIGRVLGNLIDQTNIYEKQYKEDLLLRRKQFFLDLIEGGNSVSIEDWSTYMNRFNLQVEFKHLAIAVIEIDRYMEFQQKYNHNDQNLLKFALTNAINEFIADEQQSIWVEWLTSKRFAVLLISNDNEEVADLTEKTYNVLDKFRTWVMVNLKLSITAGFGGSVDQLNKIQKVYRDSIVALQYKMSLGDNRVIRLDALNNSISNDTNKYVQMMNGLVKNFRITNHTWKMELEQFFTELEHEVLTNVEIQYVLNFLIGLFNQEMEGITPEIALVWKERVNPSLVQTLEESDIMETIRPKFIGLLGEIHNQYVSIRESNTNYVLINKIRQYIEENYANPDISLNHISDLFDINGKYASQLFKDAIGMKFVDFLVNLRMEQAKKLLLQTDESINDISIQVGYIHAISFGRTFKKVVGVTPGDFRKYMNV